VRAAQRAPARYLSQGLHAATLCADGPFPWPAGTPDARRPALARAAARRRARAAPGRFDAATAARNGIVATCAHWPPMPGEGARVARRLPPVRTLLLAGDEDLSTPLEWARREAAVAPRGRLLVIPGAGHSTLTHERRAVRALARFLDGS
jgi:alpha-beta hydrolase superfamily lysophospholipase